MNCPLTERSLEYNQSSLSYTHIAPFAPFFSPPNSAPHLNVPHVPMHGHPSSHVQVYSNTLHLPILLSSGSPWAWGYALDSNSRMHTCGDTQALEVANGIGLGISESCTPRAWSTTMLCNATTTSHMWLLSPWNATSPNWDVLWMKITSWNLKTWYKKINVKYLISNFYMIIVWNNIILDILLNNFICFFLIFFFQHAYWKISNYICG